MSHLKVLDKFLEEFSDITKIVKSGGIGRYCSLMMAAIHAVQWNDKYTDLRSSVGRKVKVNTSLFP